MGGCAGSQNSHRRQNNPQNYIILLVRRIKFSFEQKQLKRKNELKQQQALLLEHFHKNSKERSRKAQQALINRTVYYDNISKIYFICEIEAKIILDNKDSLQNNVDFVRTSFHTLIYCSSILKEEVLLQLETALKKNYPTLKYPEDSDIRHDLVKLHKKTETVPFEMENDYIMAFANNYGLEMTKICDVGHRYAY